MLRSLFAKVSPGLIVKEATAAARAITEHEQRLLALCRLPAEQALLELATPAGGLSDTEVGKRRATFGTNTAGQRQRTGFLMDIVRRFCNPLAIQLLIIAGVSALMDAFSNPQGDFSTTAIVGGMVVLSVGLSFVQETRSSRAVEKLRAMVQSSAAVLRNGVELDVPIDEIVPGDIILLHAGAIIPADLRLLSAKDFFVSQSALTGESMPVEKTAEPSDSQGRGALALPNACFQGSNVLSGTGRGLVVNTGARTFFGAIAERLAGQRTQTSFDKGIKDFTWLMVRFMVIMVALVFLVVGLTKHNWFEALLFALTVSVGLTPEMLPMIVTVNLSKGALMMSRKKVIVKQLPSIQNFGAMDVLCTDKTGTLTIDHVILEIHCDVFKNESDEVLRDAYLISHFQTGLKNVLDRAVLKYSELHKELSVDKFTKVDEIPFDFSRRRMSVVVAGPDGQRQLLTKGAPESVFKRCTHFESDGEIFEMEPILVGNLIEQVNSLSEDGFRVLAIANKKVVAQTAYSKADEDQLVLTGYLAFLDPPKDTSAKAITALRQHGVTVKVLTGDNDLVTRKVCTEVGINAEKIILGNDVEKMSDEQLADVIDRVDVYARLSPAHKKRVVQALQKKGHVVGFMGDGINDAPALRAADVGISVDNAVDIAKESADVILLEKDLMVLEEGVIEGRKVFVNILKYVRMGASSNFGNMFSMLGAAYLFKFQPILPLQILTNNLLYDFSQVPIPTDNVGANQIAKPRPWQMGEIAKFMVLLGPISSIFDYTTFAMMWFVFKCTDLMAQAQAKVPGMVEQFKGEALDHTHAAQMFHTGWFVESIMTQTLIIHVIRTNQIPFIQSRASWQLSMTTILIMLIGAVLPYSPLAGPLGFVPLPWLYWVLLAVTLVCYVALTQVIKSWMVRKNWI